jgi:DDE superfamily endonuclease
MWRIPPKRSAEFAYHMEDVLEVHCRPFDPKRPVVRLDETFRQLAGETREPLPARPGAVERYDHVCVRDGVASLFLACEPLAGWRHVAATEHRRRGDWAHLVRDLLDGRHREAERVVLAMDQPNTHSLASSYEAFAPEEAKRPAERVELRHTPEHGSWPNMAEIESSVPGRQCPAGRVARHDTLRRHAAQWQDRRNATQAKVTWHLTTDQARAKLRSLYPSFED